MLSFCIADAETASGKSLSSKKFRTLLKVMPDHLWGVDKRRKAQADRMWEKNDFDKAVLTSKQFEEFEQLLRKGDPYKTERRKELQLSLDVYGYKEPVFVNVCAPPKYKANCGETFGMVMTFHGGP